MECAKQVLRKKFAGSSKMANAAAIIGLLDFFARRSRHSLPLRAGAASNNICGDGDGVPR